jgi:hypothetical protein
MKPQEFFFFFSILQDGGRAGRGHRALQAGATLNKWRT